MGMMHLKVFMMRYMFSMADKRRDKGLAVPSDIQFEYAIPYGAHKKDQTLDVYQPRSQKGKLPVIVNVHGGGYVYGSTKPYKFYCMYLAQQGYVVINYNYRLAPQHKFPAALEDLNTVIQWVVKHAKIYGMDLQNVYMIGDSAGAQIASQYATMYANKNYAKLLELRLPRFRLAALGLNCGMYDMKTETRKEGLKQFIFDAYFSKNLDQWGDKLDVLKYITSDFPPTYLMSAPGDFLLSHCEPMATFLQSKQIETAHKIYGNENTGHVFQLDIRSEVAKEANADQMAFFSKHRV